ncbi:hypothetical protein [Metabacillus fastidiosus]|uniref:hypothetical protein n=1 Tax=Metabacillus fastidiosus TaxID=1458 RepID=UPI003D2922E2
MGEDIQGRDVGIGADVILEFNKSIANIQAFGKQMESIDAKFGRIDVRIDTMKSSLSAFSTQTFRAIESNLKKQLEQEVNNMVAANGMTLSSIGTAPLKIKQEAAQHLFTRVNNELNRVLLKQVENIHVKVDPNSNTGIIPIGKDQFDTLNKDIVKKIRESIDEQLQHMRAEVDSVNTEPGSINRNRYIQSTSGGGNVYTNRRASDLALTSNLESLILAISKLTDSMKNMSQGSKEDSGLANFIKLLGNNLIKADGSSNLLNESGFQNNLANIELYDKLWGSRGLSGRTQEGNINSLRGLLDGDSHLIHENNATNKAFVNQAMSNSVLAPYIAELSEMDDERKNEIERYMRDTRGTDGRASDLADFFAVMDESRGYRGREKMTADERYRNSAFNARQLTSNPAAANIFTQSFSTDFVDMMADRNRFLTFNANSSNRQFTREFASMDSSRREGFVNHLERNYASIGMPISNMDDLRTAYEEFNNAQRTTTRESRNASPHLRSLSGAIADVEGSLNRVNSGNGFLDFLDNLGQRGRAAIPSISALGKSIKGVGLQMLASLASFAVEDMASAVAKNAALTVDERKMRDKKTELNAISSLEQYEQMKSEGDWLGMGLSWVERGFNTVRDTWSPGNQYAGLNDEVGIRQWMVEKYGTIDSDRILKIHNASAKKGDEWDSFTDITTQYKKDSGLQAEYEKMEYEKFKKDYEKTTAEDNKKQKMKEEFDAIRDRNNLGKWQKGDNDFDMSIKDTIGIMRKEFDKLAKNNAIELITAQLNGVQTGSVEYLELRKKQLDAESKIYQHQMDLSRKNIKMFDEQLDELKRSGKDEEWDKKKGKKVKSDEYEEIERKKTAEEEKQKAVEEEFELSEVKREEEERRLDYQSKRKPIDDRVEDASYSRQIADLKTTLGTSENSSEFYGGKIKNAQQELDEMKAALAQYQAIDPSLDIDGETKNIIRNLEKSILDQTLELRNLRLSKLFTYREDLSEFRDNQSIDMLRQQIALGGVDSNDPALKEFRINQLAKERGQVESHISKLKSALSDPNLTSDEISKIQAEIRDLTKQSLQAQLGIQQELKAQMGGTFNLPEGVRVMSQYDYMASKGTHSNMTMQSGDMYVNITLPNVTNKSSSQQLTNIGSQLGQGLAQGRASALRSQLNGSPFGYRTF